MERVAVEGALLRAHEVEQLARARDAHVGQAALLFHLGRVLERAAVREDALLQAGDEDDRELQALGSVQGDQRHRLGVATQRISVRDERHILQEGGQALAGRQALVVARHGAELLDVRPALLALVAAVAEVARIAGAL